MSHLQVKNSSNPISIAPMLDWTDRHFRRFLRLISKRALFYTEMVAAPAILLGDRSKLLEHDLEENPLILQIGGSDPQMMKECAKIAEDYGYQGININAGCPSSRVQAGKFGAILMKTPEIVAECISQMRSQTRLPVSVKTRIALSDVQGDGYQELFHFSDLVVQAGCQELIIHARKAKLNISPKDNRQKLDLNYDLVYRLKKSFPDVPVVINGNIRSVPEIQHHLKFVNGVMIGRFAYTDPYGLSTIDKVFYGDIHPILSRKEILEAFMPYLENHKQQFSIIAPHLMGLFHGEPNAKHYRQVIMNRDIAEIKEFLKGA